MKRRPPIKQIKDVEEPMNCHFYKELKTLDGLNKKAFPVFQDSDIFGNDLPKFSRDGKETLIDST